MTNCGLCKAEIGDASNKYTLYTSRSEKNALTVCRECLVSKLDQDSAQGCACCNTFMTQPMSDRRATELLYAAERQYGGGPFFICPQCTNKRERRLKREKLFVCDHCHHLRKGANAKTVEGFGTICTSCQERLAPCDWCEAPHIPVHRGNARNCTPNDQVVGGIETRSITVCPQCMQNESSKCGVCNKTHMTSTLVDGQCQRCLNSNPFTCEICGKRREECYKVNFEGVSTLHHDVCNACYDRQGGRCQSCNTYHMPLGARGHHNHTRERRLCPICAGGAVITDWRYRGRIRKFGTGPLFYGVENENEFNTQNGVDSFRRYYQNMMNKCWLVHDGTLGIGVEVAFQPMSFDYWMGSTGDNLIMDTRRLVNREYDLQGVHIHMSKDAFSTRHLYRFINFLTVYKPLLAFVAGRDVGMKRNFWDGERVVNIAKQKSSPDKYKFINAKPTHTVEIRLFKGAFHQETVRMYIQFLDAVFHYTKDVRAKDTRLEDFLGYLDSQKLVYPLAQAFLSKSSADDFNAIDHSSIREEVDEDELPSDDEGVLPSNIAQGLDPTPFQQFIDRASEEMQQPIPRTQRYTTVPEPGMAWPLGDNARTTTQPARQSVRVERVPIWDEVLTQQVTASEPEFNDGWEEE